MERNTVDEIIELCKAYKEGKALQVYEESVKEWHDVVSMQWSFSRRTYRIKPEPKLRPYTFKEFQKEVIKHKPYLKLGSEIVSICGFTSHQVGLVKYRGMNTENYSTLCSMTWLDTGLPCGVYEEV